MSEISATDMYQNFLLMREARSAGEAVHALFALKIRQLGDGFENFSTRAQLNKTIEECQKSLHDRFNLGGPEILRQLGIDQPVTQIYRGRSDGLFHAYKTWPMLYILNSSDQSDTEYMLQVPVAYDGTVQVPKPSHPVLKDHFVHLGEGNYGVRGYGMICVPAIVDVIRECTDMPRDFDAKKHNWLQLANNPQPRTALTSLDMIPS